jgi:MFS family permease
MESSFFGRKHSLSFLFGSAIITLLLIIFLFTENLDPHIMILLRFIISSIYSIIYVYSTEFYPTDIRSKGLAYNSICGRLSSIIFPILVEILDKEFFILVSVIFSISFILSFFLKETYNLELEQTTKAH